MALTRLSDVVIPEVYESYTAVNNPEKTAAFESGIVTRNEMLDSFANQGGDTLNVPFWNDLDPTVAPNLSSDDPNSSATPNKLTAGRQIARMAYLNQAYSQADLAAALAGSSPMQRIRDRFGRYWERQWQRRLLESVNGIIADNLANDSGDMVNDISTEDGANATADNKFNDDAFVDAAFTMGDMVDGIAAMVLHSEVMKTITKSNDAEDVRDSEGNLLYRAYKGIRLIQDDASTLVEAGGTSGFKYTTIMFGQGAFGYGEGSPLVPVEVDRKPEQGDGGGVEALWERRHWLLHPFGFQFTSSSVAGQSPELNELATAANWDRVIDRKNVPMAFMISNG